MNWMVEEIIYELSELHFMHSRVSNDKQTALSWYIVQTR